MYCVEKLMIFLVLLVLGCAHVEIREPLDNASLLTLHNQQRKKPLIVNPRLQIRAQQHADWMARNDSLQHSGLDIRGFTFLGENIAAGQEKTREVMKDWLSSPGHRRNIKNNSFSQVGFGSAKNAEGVRYWCVIFAGRELLDIGP